MVDAITEISLTQTYGLKKVKSTIRKINNCKVNISLAQGQVDRVVLVATAAAATAAAALPLVSQYSSAAAALITCAATHSHNKVVDGDKG